MPANPLPGCVGALDGICIKILNPSDRFHHSTFYCRKGFYALPVQALVDSSYRFLSFSAICCGSTHDSLAHSVSSLREYLDSGKLQEPFWIAGNEAYMCTNSLVTPVSGNAVGDFEDGFNFYHYSLRMHVEQAFGMLTKKWGLLKKLFFGVTDSANIVRIAMKLHNFCLDHGAKSYKISRELSDDEKSLISRSDFWYERYKCNTNENSNKLQLRNTFNKRENLIEIIKDGNYERPAMPK